MKYTVAKADIRPNDCNKVFVRMFFPRNLRSYTCIQSVIGSAEEKINVKLRVTNCEVDLYPDAGSHFWSSNQHRRLVKR